MMINKSYNNESASNMYYRQHEMLTNRQASAYKINR